MSSSAVEQLLHVLQSVWGYPAFRPLQLPIASSVVQGRDTVALLPTGGGKSLCFQVPGLALGGTTVVISPLISLMADQVQQLTQRGIDARSLAGDLSPAQWGDLSRRPPQFAYVSPERAQSKKFRALLDLWDVRLLAIDEAHCASQWGHDFRPQYAELHQLREELAHVPCIALTASATPEVLHDLIGLLGLREPAVFQASFARPNLIWSVREVSDVHQACLRALRPAEGRQIVYVRSRAAAVRWAEFLQQHGVPAAAFHAGISRESRMELQESWSAGRIRTMVATTAFGMGIDQPDVRQVIHVAIPESPESLYQEIGRGGRDGHDAEAVILLDSQAKNQFERKMERSMPDFASWVATYHDLASRAQIAYGDGKGVRIKPKTSQDEVVLRTLARKGLAEQEVGRESRLRIQLPFGGSQLVDLAEANPKYAELLYGLARSFPGIVHHPETMELPSLAQIGPWTMAQARKLAAEAHELGLLDLQFGEDGGTFIWNHPRFPAKSSPISRAEWDADRDRILRRARAVVRMLDPYAATCRFRQMLRYFGEEGKDCGRCDVCRSKDQPGGHAKAIMEAMGRRPDGRMPIMEGLQVTGIPRASYTKLVQQGADFGWWEVSSDGWLYAR